MTVVPCVEGWCLYPFQKFLYYTLIFPYWQYASRSLPSDSIPQSQRTGGEKGEKRYTFSQPAVYTGAACILGFNQH